jgi:hypothetical protein
LKKIIGGALSLKGEKVASEIQEDVLERTN